MIDDLNVNQRHAGKDKRQGSRYKVQGTRFKVQLAMGNRQWTIGKFSNKGAIKPACRQAGNETIKPFPITLQHRLLFPLLFQ